MAVETKHPNDAPDKALFMYRGSESIRVSVDQLKRSKQEIDEEIAKLRREGWNQKRFAQMVFHAKLGQKVVYSPEELKDAKTKGWQDHPFKPGEATAAEAVHPHASDDHRAIMLSEEQAAAPQPKVKL